MRLTTTKEKEPELFKGLENVDEKQFFLKITYTGNNDNYGEIANKLGQLEDVLEKYGIKTIEDLNVILAEYFCEVKEHSFKCE